MNVELEEKELSKKGNGGETLETKCVLYFPLVILVDSVLSVCPAEMKLFF